MDHLILPEGTVPWFRLAYDANEKSDWYENIPKASLEYEDHYRRLGWKYEEAWFTPKPDEDTLGGKLEDQNPVRKPWEIERFYQTWLIFGLIIEVFGLSGIEVTTEEFLLPVTRKAVQRPQTARLITTKRLPELIQEWRRRHQASRDDAIQHGILKILNHVGRILDHHCAGGKEHRSIHQYGRALWSVSDATTTAIIAVASTLRKAACAIYNKPGLAEERWPVTNSKLLHQRILRKWCKSDAAMIMEDFDIDGQNYFAAATSRTLEDLDAHYDCSDHSCEAKIADGTYTTLHDPECDNDDYDPVPNFTGHVHPDYGKNPETLRQAIMDIMDAGHLPMMRWDSEQKGLNTYGYEAQSYVEDWSKARPFVAISHVWADGKGNPFDNSLPYCQLDKIQRLVDDLCANHLPPKVAHSSPGFWMDTLCCIVGPRDDENSQNYKSKSIASMREIYGESLAVLILDPWLMSTQSTAPVSEICYRIYASGWSRRLWTHQEGFLAREVYYQFQDKPLRLPEVDEMAKSFQDMMAHRGYPVTFPLQASGKTSFYYTTVKAIVHGIRDGRIPEDDKWMVYKHLAESLGYRSTTNVDDELLCVASVIGLNIKDYADLKVKGDPHHTAELRMQKFLRDIGRFRQGIIFNNYERLKIPGFRWAPVSLLGHRSSGLGDLRDPKDAKIEDYSHLNTDDIHFEVNTILGNSIKVNVNKYIPKMLNVTRKELSEMTNPLAMYFGDKVVLLPTVGLPVDYPGHIINFSSKLHGLTINMAERRFGITFSPVSTTTAILKTPTLPKVPSFGKVPTISKPKFGGFGKSSASLPEKVEAPVQTAIAVAETAAETITYKYVVFVAENDVDWVFDRDYVLILQKPLGDSKTREFLAMVGRKSVGPGKRYWVQSLCSAIVKLKSSNDDIKVDAGIDYVTVGQAATNWVVT